MQKRVAILGYSFRLPSSTTANYWEQLLAGKDLVTEVQADRWAQAEFLHPNKNQPGTSYTFAAGSIGDVAGFDAAFFGIAPREAALMDPQQRLLLELSWEALENAGIKPSSLRGSQTGVYIGIASADYSTRLADDLAAVDSSVATGNTASIAANRLSYVLDLRGPSMAIDTACSSSMVAFHQACQSILSGENEQALVGGVSLHLHPYGFIVFSKASMLSRLGHCNVFDAAGDGYVRSEGGGIFVLKDYDLAVAAGDPIVAVVAGSAVNTDGKKTGLTVPSHTAQADLLRRAYAKAGITADQIDYIEAHGTGTAVGDPIETRAIGEALGQLRSNKQPLPIGSVKSNMGHLEAASGVAGLVKALHCIQYRMVPATIGIKKLNPNIKFTELNLDVVTSNRPLKAKGELRIGVNSFGFGGANAHVILQSPTLPAQKKTAASKQALPILISAKTEAAVAAVAADLHDYLNLNPKTSLADLAYNLSQRREKHPFSSVAFCRSLAEVKAFLTQVQAGSSTSPTNKAIKAANGPVFVFSGNGSQWAGMGKTLLQEDATFKQAVAEIDSYFQPLAAYSLADELAGLLGPNRYQCTEIAQPALFAIQVGIVRMLQQRGIQPQAVIGHSVGEVAAAWAAGALSLADATQVIYHRSRLQGLTAGKGEMTAVAVGAAEINTLLATLQLNLVVAGVNSSRGVTVAGAASELLKMEAHLQAAGRQFKRLDLDYAFHSPAMDSIEQGVIESLANITPVAGHTPFYSTVSGCKLEGTKLTAKYWWNNIRQPVLFDAAAKALVHDKKNIFIEIGSHAVLRSYLSDALKDSNCEGLVVPTLGKNQDSPNKVWLAAHKVITAGAQIDWAALLPASAAHLRLPNYPWQRERHWHPVTSESLGLLSREKVHPLLGYPLAQHQFTWENKLDTLLLPTLADHVVGDAIVFPGTAYIELALAAAQAQATADCVEIEALEIFAPLLLSAEQSKLLRVVIDDRDGSLQITARDFASEDSWTLHAKARIKPEPNWLQLNSVLPALPLVAPHFTGESHQALTHAAGLNYGAAFQCIQHGWLIGSQAVAVLALPAEISQELSTHHLHPAVLDCTFQLIIQLLQDELADLSGIAFVPVQVGHVAYSNNPLPPMYASAEILQRSPHSLTAQFVIYDAEQQVIAVIQQARFRSIRLRKDDAEQLHLLKYQAEPAPLGRTIAHLPHGQLNQHCAALFTAWQDDAEAMRFAAELEPLLDSMATRLNITALKSSLEAGATQLPLDIAQHSALYQSCIGVAVHDQWLKATTDGWQFTDADDDGISANAIWHALTAEYPDYFQLTHALGLSGLKTQALLAGQTDAAIQFPLPSYSQLWHASLGHSRKSALNQLLAAFLAQSLAALPAGARLSVLEISDGAAVYAPYCAQHVDFSRCDYTFACTSSDTLAEQASLQAQFPELQLHTITAASEALAAVDLAIVNLDFSTPDAAHLAIDHALSRVTEQGQILVIGRQRAMWLDTIFAGSDCEQLNLPQQYWHDALSKAQCDIDTTELAHDLFYLVGTKQAAALAPAISSSGPTSYLLLADPSELPAELLPALEQQLRAAGQNPQFQLLTLDESEIRTQLHSAFSASPELKHVIYLADLYPAAAAKTAEAVLNIQARRCALVTELLKSYETHPIDADFWILSCGAATHLLGEASTQHAADSALWGFVRTLLNESGEQRVRLIDFASLDHTALVAQALARELHTQDSENEIIISRSGERYAPRLRFAQLDSSSQSAAEAGLVQLGFQFPGQLRHLRWENHSFPELQAEQLEVEVEATGLNFRDVMYALGLLSDEAVENGFAGPSLGLEFAGTVRRVGAAVNQYAVGDRVVGFGPSSFANVVYTTSSAIAKIPTGMSYAAASTILSVFFTVYYALHHLAQLQAGEKVLIHGAAGGVGIAAIQLAQHLGAEIYATAGSDEKRAFLRQLGVEHIYDSRSLSFADEILQATQGEGVDVVLNSLAGEAVNRNFQVLKPFGRFLELGKRDFYENTKVGLRPFRNNISYFGIDADQLMQVRPALTQRLFGEVMAMFEQQILTPLPYHVFDAAQVVDAFRHMQQAKQIGKIVVTYTNGIGLALSENKAYSHIPVKMSAEGTYLVTGGLNGFGLKTAQWLASKGARHLTLISRSGPTSAAAKTAIAELEQQGVQVHALACDVTDFAALSQLFAQFGSSLPPLKGIIHAAVVIDDALVRNTELAQIHKVLAPKMLGADYLHQLSLSLDLAFFVLYSSATTLFGNPGQASYVAANMYLEALAIARRAQGLPATSVCWGAIEDVGFLARNEKIKDALQSRMGGQTLDSSVALDYLEQMLLTDSSGLGLLELDWHALARFLPSANSPKFSKVAQLAGKLDQNEDHSGDIQHLLNSLSETELQTTFVEMVKNEVGQILRIASDKIDAHGSVYEMGLDSLMGVELVMALENRFGSRLSVMALSESPTIYKLTERLIAQLKGRNSTTSAEEQTLAQIQQITAQHGTTSETDAKQLAAELSAAATANIRIIQ